MSAARPQPPAPFAHAQRAFPPPQAPNVPGMLHRPQPGVQWSNGVPPPPPPPPPPAAAPATTPESPKEPSAVDRKWGCLFDQNDLPTKRWEKVIRGIGNYLVSLSWSLMQTRVLTVVDERVHAPEHTGDHAREAGIILHAPQARPGGLPFHKFVLLSPQLRTRLTTMKRSSVAGLEHHPPDWQSYISSWHANITSSRPSLKRGPQYQG
jgi:hypothetical protein